MAPNLPVIKKLMERLKLSQYESNSSLLSFEDMELVMKFNQAFSKNTNNFLFSIIGEGDYKIENANTLTLQGRVKSAWKGMFTKSLTSSLKGYY